jgi:opacity protein-like surface antigen
MMKRTLLAALAVAVTGLFGAAPADAQDFPDYKFDLGINGGFAWYSDMLDDAHLGNDAEDVKLESGWIVGLNGTYWFTPRVGLRANGAFSERPLVLGSYDEISGNDNTDLVNDVNLWSVSGDLMYRPLADGYRMFGAASMPFIALGLGAKYTDIPFERDLGNDYRGARFTEPQTGNQYAIVEEWQLMGLLALGTDLRFSDRFALRLELGDRIWDSPLRDMATFAADPDEDVGKVQHELYLTLGAQFLMGLVPPPVIAPAPAPPAPRPQPAPAPVEERIRVCVVDPGATNGLRMVDAIYLPETRDTMVVVDGTRRAFSTTLPRVTVANEADWFVRGEPLTVTLADDATIEYTTWQSARMIEADQLTFLGTSRGLPVYASTDDVRDMRTAWATAQRSANSWDLNAIVAQDAMLAAGLEEVEYLYVPLRPTGCVFQTVRIVEQVRKK